MFPCVRLPGPFLPVPVVALLAASACALPATASAAGSQEDVVYDFLSRSLTVRGYHVPKEAERKNGLAAELDARRNGVAVLSAHIAKSCEGGTSSPRLAPGWQQSLNSRGSEIFANGVLRIILAADLKKVFKEFGSAKAKALRTPEGQAVVFRLPTLPQGAIACGAVTLEYGGKRLEASPVALGEPGDGARLVNLLLGSGGLLRVASPEDATLLEKANFPAEVTVEGEGIVLPVAQGG